MNRIFYAMTFALLLHPVSGWAETPAANWYLSLDTGASAAADSSVDYGGSAAPSRALKFQTGWGGVGTSGWEIHPSLRLEVQVGFTRNSVRAISSGGSAGGSTAATTTMLVGRWQWPIGMPVRPFGALGVGRAWVSQNLIADGATLLKSSASSWAYQASVGALVPLMEGLDLDLSYRYLGTERGLFLDSNFLLYHSGFASHVALVGLTWRIR